MSDNLSVSGLVALLESKIGIIEVQDDNNPRYFPLAENRTLRRIPRIAAGILEKTTLGPVELDILLGNPRGGQSKDKIFKDVICALEESVDSDPEVRRILYNFKREILKLIAIVDPPISPPSINTSLVFLFQILETTATKLPPLPNLGRR